MWHKAGQMAREHDPDEPRIYLLPNLMTAGNLCCGFFAVLTIFKGLLEVQRLSTGEEALAIKEHYLIARQYYETAILLIFGSCLFDLLDGRLARLGGQDSQFGREFDSLADIVSFGMAPAMLVSKAVLFPLRENVGWILGFVYLLCGAMRLARFNCLMAAPRKPGENHDFRGIPIPMAAGFIASLTFLIIDIYQNDRELGPWKYVLAGIMLGLSALMISDVRYPSFKRIDWRTRGTLGAIVLAMITLVLTVRFYHVMPVVLFSGYLVYGLVRPWVSKRWRHSIEAGEEREEEADTGADPPPDA